MNGEFHGTSSNLLSVHPHPESVLSFSSCNSVMKVSSVVYVSEFQPK